jgi:hypothetical protein
MEKNQRITCAFIILIGLVYFCLLIPANLTGAADPEMLSVFEVEIYAQYPHVIQMLTPVILFITRSVIFSFISIIFTDSRFISSRQYPSFP